MSIVFYSFPSFSNVFSIVLCYRLLFYLALIVLLFLVCVRFPDRVLWEKKVTLDVAVDSDMDPVLHAHTHTHTL